MNETIAQLLNLQNHDSEIDFLKTEAAAIPAKVSAIQKEIQTNKTALETAKKELIQFQMAKKNKDMDLDTRETAMRKHTGELNAVKTNEAYKALLGEIEKAKQEKSVLEDEVLQLMEQIEQAHKVWKEKEASAKGIETGLQKQISNWEAKQKELEGQVGQKQSEREAASAAMSKKLVDPYERLRSSKRSNAIVPIRKEQCTGCHMKVSQNLLNEIRRGQKMMACESCARIVFLEDVPQEAKPA